MFVSDYSSEHDNKTKCIVKLKRDVYVPEFNGKYLSGHIFNLIDYFKYNDNYFNTYRCTLVDRENLDRIIMLDVSNIKHNNVFKIINTFE